MNARLFDIVLLVASAIAAATAALFLDPGLLFLYIEVVVIMLLAQMWNLLAGFGGQISLGQQAFVGLGGYLLFTAANETGISIWVWMVAVPVIVGLLAIPLGLVMFHLKHAYFAVGMWVVAEIFAAVASKAEWLGGSGGMILRPAGTSMIANPERVIFFVAAFGLAVIIVAQRLFLRSDAGLALLAMRDSEAAAQASGVDVRRMHLLIFCLAAVGCAAGGSLYYATTLYIAPTDAFQMNWLISMMFVTIIGGVGTLTGPILGTLLFIGIREVMTSAGFTGEAYWTVMGALAVIVLLTAPRGLWPAISNLLTTKRRMSAQ